MLNPSIIKDYYFKNRVKNPINFTLTQKQVVDGQWVSDTVSEQNFRHFTNKINRKVFGKSAQRHGKKLGMFVVRECDETHRHHIHCIIECPEGMEPLNFTELVHECWVSTRFGYYEMDFEIPETDEREIGWVGYCLKRRSKAEYSSSIDWSNSTCFELRRV
jgi:hypothetical protein